MWSKYKSDFIKCVTKINFISKLNIIFTKPFYEYPRLKIFLIAQENSNKNDAE